jgi:hypothetical protein
VTNAREIPRTAAAFEAMMGQSARKAEGQAISGWPPFAPMAADTPDRHLYEASANVDSPADCPC